MWNKTRIIVEGYCIYKFHSLLKSDIHDYILYAFSLDEFMYSQL